NELRARLRSSLSAYWDVSQQLQLPVLRRAPNFFLQVRSKTLANRRPTEECRALSRGRREDRACWPSARLQRPVESGLRWRRWQLRFACRNWRVVLAQAEGRLEPLGSRRPSAPDWW